MSRIGNFPVELPTNVEVLLSASEISVKGPLGTLKQALSAQIKVEKVVVCGEISVDFVRLPAECPDDPDAL